MSFARSYDGQQPISILDDLEGTVVIRLTPQRNPVGPGAEVLALVGEWANDQGSDTTKTIVNTLREITSADQLLDYGGVSSAIGLASDGYEGNASIVAALPGFVVPRLVVIAPDLAAGSVTFTRSSGGDAYTIPAGTKVSDGSTGIFLTLEDVTFAQSGSSQTGSARVRPLSSAVTATVAIGDLDTIVTTLDASVTSVANAAEVDASAVDFDAAYEEAIDVLGGDTGLAGEVTHVLCRRHTAAIRTALIATADLAAAGRRAFMAYYSPPIATVNTTAVGSSGVGVAATGGRNKRLRYCYPEIQTRVSGVNSGNLFDLHADVFAAQQAASRFWYENPAERSSAPYVLGMGSQVSTAGTIGVAPTQAQYTTWRALGISSPQITPQGAEILSDRTTDLTAPYDAAQYVSTVDGLAAALHDVGMPWAKKLRSDRNKRILLGEVAALFETLLAQGAIVAYSLDATSGNTAAALAAGLHVIKANVQTTGSMRTIVFSLNAGDAVDVSVAQL